MMVAKGLLGTLSAIVELNFEFGEILFKERFIVMTNLTSPITGLLYLHKNITILDMRQGVLNFLFFYMQLKD